MAGSSKNTGKDLKSLSKEDPSLQKWIFESSDGSGKNIYLNFPSTIIKSHSSGKETTLRLVVYRPSETLPDVAPLSDLKMYAFCEFPSVEAKRGDIMEENHQASLHFPPHHMKSSFIPEPQCANRIKGFQTKWGTSISCRGEIQYLCGFWEWTIRVSDRLIRTKNCKQLRLAVRAAAYDYYRPNSMYRALCELWCPSTNTFLTNQGEIGISLWEMRDITGLSIDGEYYEEVVPQLKELNESLPKTCLYLFEAFSWIAAERNTDRVRHEDWINFWFQHDNCIPNPNPSTSKLLKTLGVIFKEGKLVKPVAFSRPFLSKSRSKTSVGSEHGVEYLESLIRDLKPAEKEDVEIAAYLVLWLCRYLLPSKDNYIRPGTFKAASRMATGISYSLVPPILASIYRGLSSTFTASTDKKESILGLCTSVFPGHFLYAWAGLHFPRGVYASIDKELSSPTIRRFRGTLNAYQSWEINPPNCREMLRDDMNHDNFCWVPVLPLSHPAVRLDNVVRSQETSDFLISIHPGYLSYRRGLTYVLEMYNPHRFARQHGFLQKHPGKPKSLPQVNPTTLYCAWLSLTAQQTGATFYIPRIYDTIGNQVDEEYSNWLRNDVLPILNEIPSRLLEYSEDVTFPGNLPRDSRFLSDDVALVNVASSNLPHIPQKRNPADSIIEASNKPSKCLKTTSKQFEEVIKPLQTSRLRSQIVTKQTDENTALSGSGKSHGKGINDSPEKRNQEIHPTSSPILDISSNVVSSSSYINNAMDLNMSPGTRNAAFPMVPDFATFMPDLDIPIGALEGLEANILDDISGGNIPSDGEEVSSGIQKSTLPDGRKKTATSHAPQVPLFKTIHRGPKFSTMSSRPVESLDVAAHLKKVLLEGMHSYITSLLVSAMESGFSNLRVWWTSNAREILDNAQAYFHIKASPFEEVMETYLKRVDIYLAKRQENVQALSEEERKRNWTSVEGKISALNIKGTTLTEESSRLIERQKIIGNETQRLQQAIQLLQQENSDIDTKLDFIYDEQSMMEEELCVLNKQKDEIQNSKVRDPASIEAVDMMRLELEEDLKKLAHSDWVKQTL